MFYCFHYRATGYNKKVPGICKSNLPYPSAILAVTDLDDLFIWDVNMYFSSAGNFLVSPDM